MKFDSKYVLLHVWVTKHLGRPKKCDDCGMADPSRTYNWANISKKYRRDLSDFKRLCVPCHRKFDYKTYCLNGHPFKGFNLVLWGGRRCCRKCKLAQQKKRRENGPPRKRYYPSLKQLALMRST